MTREKSEMIGRLLELADRCEGIAEALRCSTEKGPDCDPACPYRTTGQYRGRDGVKREYWTCDEVRLRTDAARELDTMSRAARQNAGRA